MLGQVSTHRQDHDFVPVKSNVTRKNVYLSTQLKS